LTAIFNGRMKYLFLVPIALLILFAYLNLLALSKLNAEIMADKKGSIQAHIDYLADLINTSDKKGKTWGQTDFENILAPVVSDINRDASNVFVALYSRSLSLMSGNISGANLKIYDINQLPRGELFSKQSGWADASYTKNGSQKIPMFVYFRWITNGAPGTGYLLTAGVSADNLTINNSGWLTAGMIAQLTVTFLMNTAFVVLLCYLGAIYSSRGGDKWRQLW